MTFRPIAIHLPQFHPIPENDLWWGKGFTEWTNVAKAKPRFKGHYQPHVPADLGFYDLRLPESRNAQAELAQEYGIYGFCYYHYWFNGRRVLEKPVNDMVQSGNPDFPFCLCWANENWSRTWDGSDHQILLKQEHNIEDDKNHMKYLCSIFKDKRYIRINGKPVFIVYRTALFPNIQQTSEVWRQVAKEEGVGEIYLCFMERSLKNPTPESIGFDASIEFQPDNYAFPKRKESTIYQQLVKKITKMTPPEDENMIFDYEDVVKNMLSKERVHYKRYPGITPMWDNSARKRSNAVIFKDSTPELYHQWLEAVLANFQPYSKDENFVFINAWNEWAEGNHLEPCLKWGRKYLELTKAAFDKYQHG